MFVSQVCKRNVITVRKHDEVTEAARLMRDRHVGYLVVVEPDFAGSTERPVGVLTDRDIVVGLVAQNVNPRGVRVEDVMTREPVVISQNATIASAVDEMRRVGVRRMPVVGSLGELTGLLSLDEVLDLLSSELKNLSEAVRTDRGIDVTMRR